jgi:hypothetical protein
MTTTERHAPRPPIPASLEERPTVGGLVVPWVNVELADGGVDFRAQHHSRAIACWTQGLCQVCGNALRRPLVLLCTADRLKNLVFDAEPPLHPECCVYTSHACPMIGGRQTHYRAGDAVSEGARGQECADPGCDCGGWVATPAQPGDRSKRGTPAHPWYAVYATGYELVGDAANPGQVLGGMVRPDQVLVVRHVSTPGEGRVWRRVDDPLDDYTSPVTEQEARR